MKKFISICLCCLTVLSLFVPGVSAYLPYEAKYALGDVDNSNGEITASDALLALQAAVGKIELGYDEEDAADVDVDWVVTASDALKILQTAVGKIELTKEANVYDTYELNYVEPFGLDEYTLYQIKGTMLVDSATGKDYDMMRLAACMQGLINRNNDEHHVAVAIMYDANDATWIDFMREDGAYYADYEIVNVDDLEMFFDIFLPFIEECGIIVWDPNAPSTANIASTICGLENYLPVQFSTKDGSVYDMLVNDYEVNVEMNLCELEFSNAKLGGTIADTDLESTGSAKCDPYIWAIDKYMDRCNPEMLAYTLDGASAVEGHHVQTDGDGGWGAAATGIINHDYFVLKQMFFFDLSPFAGEPATDDKTQPLGTDVQTMQKILQKRYDMAGAMFGMVIGFPPWGCKYTAYKNIGGTQPPTRVEWAFVEICGTYNCGIEADAPHPAWLSNASLFTKYEMRYEPVANAEPDETIEYDPDTYYWSQVYAGDYDCSPWLKKYALEIWGDETLGDVPITYNYSVSLIERVPVIFDYIYSKKTPYTFLTTGEGTAYTNISALYQGFVGKEFNTDYAWASVYQGDVSYNHVRTLPDGDRAYIHYITPYIQSQLLDISGQIINGFTAVSNRELSLLSHIAPAGGILQSSTANAELLRYNDTPFTCLLSIGGATNEERAMLHRTNIKGTENKFFAAAYLDIGEIIGTPSGFKEFKETFEDYISYKETKVNIQFVDIATFYKLLAESGRGSDRPEYPW